VVSQFDPESAAAIKEFQELMKKNSILSDLAFIHCHLSFLPTAITKLEEDGLPLVNALKILEECKEKINAIPGSKGLLLQGKLHSVLHKNPGLKTLTSVGQVLENQGQLPDEVGPADAARLRFCPMANVDCERSFSTYKVILSDRRHSLTQENLSQMMVCHCFFNRGAQK